jgi:hypothetical protein
MASTINNADVQIYRYTTADGGKWYDSLGRWKNPTSATAVAAPDVKITHEIVGGEIYAFRPDRNYTGKSILHAIPPSIPNSPCKGCSVRFVPHCGTYVDEMTIMNNDTIIGTVYISGGRPANLRQYVMMASTINNGDTTVYRWTTFAGGRWYNDLEGIPIFHIHPPHVAITHEVWQGNLYEFRLDRNYAGQPISPVPPTSVISVSYVYDVDFTRLAWDGITNLATVLQREVRVTFDGERFDDFVLFIYDANGILINFIESIEMGGEIGRVARISDDEYGIMRSWEVYLSEQVDDNGNTTGEPIRGSCSCAVHNPIS